MASATAACGPSPRPSLAGRSRVWNLSNSATANTKLSDAGAEALATACASAATLPKLHALLLYGNEIGDAGMRALAAAIAGGSLAALEWLQMRGNLGSSEPVEAALRQREAS